MGLPPADYDVLVRRSAGARVVAPLDVGWNDGALTVFVPGTPSNPLNGSHAHWTKHRTWAKGWRDRAGTRLMEFALRGAAMGWPPLSWGWTPETPKLVTFTVYSRSAFDDDGMAAACKPVRDALKDVGLVNDDKLKAGHTFTYRRGPTAIEWRKLRGLPRSSKEKPAYGVAIRIEVKP